MSVTLFVHLREVIEDWNPIRSTLCNVIRHIKIVQMMVCYTVIITVTVFFLLASSASVIIKLRWVIRIG